MKFWTYCLLLIGMPVMAQPDLPGVDAFIDEMVVQHQFERQELQALFQQVDVKQSILKAISRPAEKSIPWYRYQAIFVNEKRIRGGVKFWSRYRQTLDRAKQVYSIPPEILVALIGVETRYGENMGHYRVIDALSTLAFHYPARQRFFRGELANFLILTRQEKLSPLMPHGSYAGAMGWGQFMPSSYLSYAIDFNGDGHRNIWTDPVDAIGSVANYLARHGWQAGKSLVYPVKLTHTPPVQLLEKGYRPSLTRTDLEQAGIPITDLPNDKDKWALIALTQKKGEEYWLVGQNFYVITRYNHSRMYAMAVMQLAEAIKKRFQDKRQ